MEHTEFGRLLSVLISPSKTFQSIAQRPTWIAALLVSTILATGVGMVAMSKVDMAASMRAQMEERGDMTEEQIEKATETMAKFGMVFALFGAVSSVAISFLIGLLFWVTLKLLGSEMSYFASLSTALHGLMPNVVAAILVFPVILGQESLDLEAVQGGRLLASSLAAFAPEESGKVLLALLSSIDVFSLWSIALLALGYQLVGRVSRTAAWGSVLTIWLLYVLGKVGFTAAFS